MGSTSLRRRRDGVGEEPCMGSTEVRRGRDGGRGSGWAPLHSEPCVWSLLPPTSSENPFLDLCIIHVFPWELERWLIGQEH